MDFWDVVRQRRSIRAFTSDPVDDATVQRILQAINLAPSAGNRQAYEVYLVRDAATRRALARAALDQDFVAQAPVVLVFCAHPYRSAMRYGERGINLYCIQDATIATTYAMLAATDLGLATVWVGAFDDEMARQAIKAPREHQPVAILPIGHAGEKPRPTSRRPLEDIVHRV